MHKNPQGRFQGLKDLFALFGPLPLITKLIRNQETIVRYIICASSACIKVCTRTVYMSMTVEFLRVNLVF
jgi:hypothetical protein